MCLFFISLVFLGMEIHTMTTNVQNQVNTVTQTTAAQKASASTRNATNSIMLRLAQKFGVSGGDLYTTLANTCFKVKEGDAYRAPTQEELMSLLLIAEKVGLNRLWVRFTLSPTTEGLCRLSASTVGEPSLPVTLNMPASALSSLRISLWSTVLKPLALFLVS